MSEPLGVLPWFGEMSEFRRVEVSCEIQVNGETITAHQVVDGAAWDSMGEEFHQIVAKAVQQQAALEAVKKFPPKVTIRI